MGKDKDREILQEILERISSIEEKLSNSSKGDNKKKKKSGDGSFKQFTLSTEDLLDSEENLCSYWKQRGVCDGHCGRPAMYTVSTGRPEDLKDIEFEETTNEKVLAIRKTFYRCKLCKDKSLVKDKSLGYSKIKSHLDGLNDGDTAMSENISEMLGSVKKRKKKKTKKKDSDEEDDPSVEDGLDPVVRNKFLKKTDKWKHNLVTCGKKKFISVSYTDKRKNDVCIGLIEDEPEDDDYEENLEKPSETFLKKIKMVYKTPKQAVKITPPKAKKIDSDNDSDEEESSKDKAKKKKKKPVESDNDSDEEESSKAKAKKKKKKPVESDNDDSDEEESSKAKAKKKKKKPVDSDEDSDEDSENEREAFKGFSNDSD